MKKKHGRGKAAAAGFMAAVFAAFAAGCADGLPELPGAPASAPLAPVSLPAYQSIAAWGGPVLVLAPPLDDAAAAAMAEGAEDRCIALGLWVELAAGDDDAWAGPLEAFARDGQGGVLCLAQPGEETQRALRQLEAAGVALVYYSPEDDGPAGGTSQPASEDAWLACYQAGAALAEELALRLEDRL